MLKVLKLSMSDGRGEGQKGNSTNLTGGTNNGDRSILCP